MVIRDLDIQRIVSVPTEDDTPLIIDAQVPITCQITAQLFQLIAGRNSQKVQCRCRIDLVERAPGLVMQLTRQLSGITAVDSVIDILSHLICYAPKHY